MSIRELKTLAKTYKPFTGGDNGIYVSRVPDELSVQKIINLVHCYDLCQMSERDIQELHCTIMYAPAGVGSSDIRDNDLNPVPLPCTARVLRFEFWEGHDNAGYLVAVLKSDALNHIHNLWRLRGCIPTFSEYKPHMTIQTPFDAYRGLSRKLRMANDEILEEGLIIKLENERVEDIKKLSLVSMIEALNI